MLPVGCGTQAGPQVSQPMTWFQACAVGDGLPRTRGFVTTRRNATMLAQGSPTRMGPFSCRSNQSGAAGSGSYRHRSEYWHRRGSTKRFALDQRQDLGDVVDVVDQHSTRIERPRAERLPRFRRCCRIAKPAAQHVVDDLFEPNVPGAAQTMQLSGHIIINRQGRPHGIGT
jgi:hypothetical protein